MTESTHKAPGGFERRLRARLGDRQDPDAQVGYGAGGAAGSDMEIAAFIAAAALRGLTAPMLLLSLGPAYEPSASLVFPEISRAAYAVLRKPAWACRSPLDGRQTGLVAVAPRLSEREQIDGAVMAEIPRSGIHGGCRTHLRPRIELPARGCRRFARVLASPCRQGES